MAKKRIDDDFEDDFEDDFDDSPKEDVKVEDDEAAEEETVESIGGGFGDDDEGNIDIVLEIDADDLNLMEETTSEEVKDSEDEDIVLSKHKLEGKHSLKYDSIFKGKKEDPMEEDGIDSFNSFHKETIEVDKSSNYYIESIENESYIRAKLVKERVYYVLEKYTSINFVNNRRKPSRSDFNEYFNLLKRHLEEESFTNIELFNELAVYFSDNLFNMFKLLDNKWRNLIISELQDHIGKNQNSKDITNRNIYDGTEIEFEWEDQFGDIKIITGVVIETDYPNSMFRIDSYENIYDIGINRITKILNNTKFKYNLNKLNNIDFL